MTTAQKSTILAVAIAGIGWLVLGRVEQAVLAMFVTGFVYGAQVFTPLPSPEDGKPNWIALTFGGLSLIWAIYVAITGNAEGVR